MVHSVSGAAILPVHVYQTRTPALQRAPAIQKGIMQLGLCTRVDTLVPKDLAGTISLLFYKVWAEESHSFRACGSPAHISLVHTMLLKGGGQASYFAIDGR